MRVPLTYWFFLPSSCKRAFFACCQRPESAVKRSSFGTLGVFEGLYHCTFFRFRGCADFRTSQQLGAGATFAAMWGARLRPSTTCMDLATQPVEATQPRPVVCVAENLDHSSMPRPQKRSFSKRLWSPEHPCPNHNSVHLLMSAITRASMPEP